MGRRALPKIAADLDWRPWLLEEEQLPDLLAVPQLFASPGPLEIEVGSGKGLFLTRATAAHPDRRFLGIEMAGKYARFAAARLARQGATNGKVVHGDGVRIFAERLPAVCAAAVHVYFPDPWWKKRHAKRRIMQAPFVRDIQRVLQPGGVLHFWTDVADYYEATLTLLRQGTELAGPLIPAVQPASHDLDFRTHFERRTRLAAQPVYRAEFHKPAGRQDLLPTEGS